MILRPLYLNTQGLSVGKSGNVLKIKEKDKVVQEVRIGEICQLNLYDILSCLRAADGFAGDAPAVRISRQLPAGARNSGPVIGAGSHRRTQGLSGVYYSLGWFQGALFVSIVERAVTFGEKCGDRSPASKC